MFFNSIFAQTYTQNQKYKIWIFYQRQNLLFILVTSLELSFYHYIRKKRLAVLDMLSFSFLFLLSFYFFHLEHQTSKTWVGRWGHPVRSILSDLFQSATRVIVMRETALIKTNHRAMRAAKPIFLWSNIELILIFQSHHSFIGGPQQ